MTAVEFIALVQDVYEDADTATSTLKGNGVRVEALDEAADRLGRALAAVEHEPWAQ